MDNGKRGKGEGAPAPHGASGGEKHPIDASIWIWHHYLSRPACFPINIIDAQRTPVQSNSRSYIPNVW